MWQREGVGDGFGMGQLGPQPVTTATHREPQSSFSGNYQYMYLYKSTYNVYTLQVHICIEVRGTIHRTGGSCCWEYVRTLYCLLHF